MNFSFQETTSDTLLAEEPGQCCAAEEKETIEGVEIRQLGGSKGGETVSKVAVTHPPTHSSTLTETESSAVNHSHDGIVVSPKCVHILPY
jgi:hypothetical protein